MIPAKFDYHKASSVQEAVSLLEKYGYEAKILAGGQSLLPAMRLRLNRPEVVIDIGGIQALNYIREEGGAIVVGANVSHVDLTTSELIDRELNVLKQAALVVGDVQVRNRGTIGGSLAHADPAADYPAVVMATAATIVVEGPNGSRQIAAADFFQGIYTTALEENEIITAVRFPKTTKGVYLKFVQSASRFAVVGVAAVVLGGKVQVGVTGVSDMAYRAEAVENAYQGDSEAAAAHATDGIEPMGDHFASAEYRAHLAKVYVKRALDAVKM